MTELMQLRLAGLVLLLVGCTSNSTKHCMTVGGRSDLVTQAARLRLDVYDATVKCDGASVPAGSIAILSRTFLPGADIKLDVSPGTRTLVLTTFADEAGLIEMGSGCTTAMLSPGAQVCINLTLIAAPDQAVLADLSTVDNATCTGSSCGGCTVSPDSCPANQYCDGTSCKVGCKVGSDCNGVPPAGDGGLPRTTCNTTTHQCVECNDNTMCPLGKVCSPAGACVQGCDPSHSCPGTLSCCNGICLDTKTDPLNCNSCGNPCVGAANTCCNGMCVDPTSNADNCGGCGRACSTSNVATRTCAGGLCTSACTFGRGNCGKPAFPNADDGCETDETTTSNCGGCGVKCDVTSGHSSSATCWNFPDGGTPTCKYVCSGSNADCDQAAPNTNGCEVDTSSDPTHCGGCLPSFACDTTRSLGASCSGGNCSYSGCKPYFADCTSAAPDRDGCETQTTTTSNCGGCAACDNSNNATSPTCMPLDGGLATCLYNCNSPYADCVQTAPNTNGCTVNKNTDPNNCTGCSIVCDTTTGTPACNGSSCTYGTNGTSGSCNAGKADCSNLPTSVNTGGCECNTATTGSTDGGCCGTGCQTAHLNCSQGSSTTACTGLGQTYYDCTPTGTFTFKQAMRACMAKTGTDTACHQFNCSTTDGVICDNASTTSGAANAWDYSLNNNGTGTSLGLVFIAGSGGCRCPIGAWPTWN
jgi:hypothetical protein